MSVDALMRRLLRNAPSDDAAWQRHDVLVREQQAAEQAHAEAERIQRMAARLAAQGCPGELLDKALGKAPWPSFDMNHAGARALDGLGQPGQRVRVLAGQVGRGKTLPAIHWLLHHGGRRPVFLEAPALAASAPWDHAMRNLWRTATALVLDDLCEEDDRAVPQLVPRLNELINHFSEGKACLIITTNKSKRELHDRYKSERMASRFRGQRNLWHLIEGPDLREVMR